MTLTFESTILELPNPDFDDSIAIQYRRIDNKTRGNELIVGPRSGYSYLKSNTFLTYRFSYLSEIQKQLLINFIDLSAGKLTTIIDYENASWVGIITTPSAEIANASRNNNQIDLDIEVI